MEKTDENIDILGLNIGSILYNTISKVVYSTVENINLSEDQRRAKAIEVLDKAKKEILEVSSIKRNHERAVFGTKIELYKPIND